MPELDDEHSFLFKIAQAYYNEGATQEEVAQRFGVSRVKVSRMLKKAREQQVVQITVSAPSDSLAEVELQLANHLGLDELVIAAPGTFDGAAVVSALGEATAPVLLRHLGDKSTLAVSWGTTLSAVAEALPRRAMPQVTVVQMLGGLGLARGRDAWRRDHPQGGFGVGWAPQNAGVAGHRFLPRSARRSLERSTGVRHARSSGLGAGGPGRHWHSLRCLSDATRGGYPVARRSGGAECLPRCGRYLATLL